MWKGRGDDGFAFIDHIPKALRLGKPNNTEMSIQLINGSVIQFVGATNIDSIRGSNPLTVAYSEFAYLNPKVRDILSPILAQNKGIEILNSTPNGKGEAYKIFKSACANSEDWCTDYKTVDDTFLDDGVTPIISKADIDLFRRSGMAEEMIQQEFYCSWESGSVGAYYTKQITAAELEGRIHCWKINPKIPVYTFWDMGIGDSTAIWFMQPDGGKLKMVYYYEACGEGFAHYNKKLKELTLEYGFKYAKHYGPHDLRQRQWGESPKSISRIAQENGINFMIVPNISKADGINAVRAIFPDVVFHEALCEAGIQCLTHYRKEFDEENRVFKDKPLHDWSSHGADAFRYFAVMWRDLYSRPEMSKPRTFQNAYS